MTQHNNHAVPPVPSSQDGRTISSEGRRDFLKTVAGVAVTAALGGPTGLLQPAAAHEAGSPLPPDRPPAGYNILLIVTDQERHFDTYPFPVPGRERLMRRGTTFTRHENCSNVCTSSRSVLYTGWHMPTTGMFDNMGLPWVIHDLDPSLGTLGSLLTAAGYYSAYKGKWHLSNELDQTRIVDGAIDIGMQPSPRFHKILEGYGFKDYHGIGDVIGWSQGGYLYDAITTGQTVGWLRGAGQELSRQGKPWFLAVNLVNPHDVMFIDTDQPDQPRQWQGSLNHGGISMNPAQPPDHELYRATWDSVPLPASRHQPLTEAGRPPAQLEYQLARAALVGQFPDEDRRWRKLQNYYFNTIRDCDRHVETILQELDSLSLTDRTIIVFTADHGELGGYHGMHGKGSSVYRQQMNVPMIVAHPAYPGGKRCAALTNHLDLAPTLLSLTGLPEDRRKFLLGDRRGHDFSTVLAAPERAATDAVRPASLYCYGMISYTDAAYITQIQAIKRRQDLDASEKRLAIQTLKPDLGKRSGIRCVNDGRYKFARYFSLREHNTPRSMEELLRYNDIELYDLHADPEEMHNLALDTDSHGDLIRAMNDTLNRIILEEIGIDDGRYLPLSGRAGWDLQVLIE
ncbi:MAG: sulfatase-like hydrolase/transferase [Planctomycetes bacterium]|nr:sulfatase-like hydrolase/transferase [Planctomycetota bacterium]